MSKLTGLRAGESPARPYSLSVIKPSGSLSFPELLERASRFAVIGIFVLLATFALRMGGTILIPVVTACLMALVLGPPVDWLERRGINPYAASAMVMALLAVVFYALFYALAAPLDEWAQRIPAMWDKMLDKLSVLREPLTSINEVGKSLEDVSNPDKRPVPTVTVSDGGLVPRLLIVAPTFGAQLIIFLCTFYFFLANRTRLRTSVLSFCVSPRSRLHFARILRDVEFFLLRYVTATTIVNIGLGTATAIAMALLGLPAALLWGALAALLNFIPYVGPAIMAVILGGVGLASFDGLVASLLPAAVFIGLNIVEGQFVTPSFLGRTLTINPFAVFLSLAFWMWMWGPVGGLIAVPVLIVIVVVLFHLLPRERTPGAATFGKPAARAAAARSADPNAGEVTAKG